MRCYDQDKICMKRPVLLTLLILVFPMLALAADEHWELTESPIILTSTFTVAAGDTLNEFARLKRFACGWGGA